jgi:ribonuclease BN (tRNA processing enzyme)
VTEPVSLLVLGSGGGSGARFATGLALCGPDGVVLLDCGPPVTSLLPQCGEDVTRLLAVALSHWHADHVAGLPLLIQGLWLRNRARPGVSEHTTRVAQEPVQRLAVYGPPGTVARVRWLEEFHLMRLPGGYVPAEFAPAVPIDALPGQRYALGPVTAVEFFATTHFGGEADCPEALAANFGSPLVAYGMRLWCAGRTLVYSGDSGKVEDVAPYLADCDLLLHEIGHHDPERVCRFAAAHGVPRLLLCHVPEQLSRAPAELEQVFADAGAANRGRWIQVAADGMRIAL